MAAGPRHTAPPLRKLRSATPAAGRAPKGRPPLGRALACAHADIDLAGAANHATCELFRTMNCSSCFWGRFWGDFNAIPTQQRPYSQPISQYLSSNSQVSDPPHRHCRPRLLGNVGGPSCLASCLFVPFALPCQRTCPRVPSSCCMSAEPAARARLFLPVL